jgi:predicted nucleic-acid-binding Zn-ribbon protein
MTDLGPAAEEAKQQEQRRRAIAYLREIFPNSPPCPMCHQESAWDVTAPVHLSPVAGNLLATRGYPVFQVVCTRCGYTMFFNAVIAGVIDSH